MRIYLMAAAAALTLIGGTAVTTEAANAQVVRAQSGYHGNYNRGRHYDRRYNDRRYNDRRHYNRGHYNRGYYGRGYRPGVSVSLGFGYPSYGYGYGSYYPSYGYGSSYPSYGYGYPSYGYGSSSYGYRPYNRCGYRTVWRVTPRGRVKVRTRYC